MTTASQPSEEERRLLREYRVTKIPTRRSIPSVNIKATTNATTTTPPPPPPPQQTPLSTTITSPSISTTTPTPTLTPTPTPIPTQTIATTTPTTTPTPTPSPGPNTTTITPTVTNSPKASKETTISSPGISTTNRITNTTNNSIPVNVNVSKNALNGLADVFAKSFSMTTSASSNTCTPQIFEKVDYIKKISLERKLKKARRMARVVSPNTTTKQNV